MSDNPVLIEIEGKIATLTLNRPDNRNAMDSVMMPAFQDAVDQVISQKDLRCLVITGKGRNFCGGADFNDFALGSDGSKQLPNEQLFSLYKPFLSLSKVEVPIIGAMNGHAIGGGMGLALMCDIRIANNDSKYGVNFAKLGVHSGMAISYILPRIVGLPVANELLFTGKLIDGKEAKSIGLVNYSESYENILPKAMEIANEIAGCAPIAVKMMKRSIYQGLIWNPEQAAEYESHCQSRTFETEDAKEGVAALLEKRKPVFKGK